MTNKPEVTQADTLPMPEHGFTCFHCGETFKTVGGARDHFGFEPSASPACRIKLGAERGLVMALRKAESELAEAWQTIHHESAPAILAMYAQVSRHRGQLMAVEEAGYEKGLADGRADVNEALQAENARLRELVQWFVSRRFALEAKFDLHGPKDLAAALRETLVECRQALTKENQDD